MNCISIYLGVFGVWCCEFEGISDLLETVELIIGIAASKRSWAKTPARLIMASEHLRMFKLRVALASGSSAPSVGFTIDDWTKIVVEDTDMLEGISTWPCKYQIMNNSQFPGYIHVCHTFHYWPRLRRERGEVRKSSYLWMRQKVQSRILLGMQRMADLYSPSRMEDP